MRNEYKNLSRLPRHPLEQENGSDGFDKLSQQIDFSPPYALPFLFEKREGNKDLIAII